MFAGISLHGSGWHHVCGHHFHGANCHQALQHAGVHSHVGGACAHSCHAVLNETGEDHNSPLVAAIADEADRDCPLCQFFGTAQWVNVSPAFESTAVVLTLIGESESSEHPATAGLYLSRAPPACVLLS